MPPGIAHALDYDLKHLRRQPIAQVEIARRFDRDRDARGSLKPIGEASQGVPERLAVSAVAPQTRHVPPHRPDLLDDDIRKVPYVGNHVLSRLQLAADGGEPELQSDVRLNDAVVQIARDALTLDVSGIAREMIDQSDVLEHGCKLTDHLFEELKPADVESVGLIAPDIQPGRVRRPVGP